MVLLGGLVGLFALDQPLLQFHSTNDGLSLSLSAFKGIHFSATAAAKKKLKEHGFTDDLDHEIQRRFEAHPAYAHARRAEAYVMTLAMLPGFLILFGLRSLKGFGRGLGLLCLLLGLAQLSLVAITYTLSDMISGQLTGEGIHLGVAINYVLASGISASLGGLLASIKPEAAKSER